MPALWEQRSDLKKEIAKKYLKLYRAKKGQKAKEEVVKDLVWDYCHHLPLKKLQEWSALLDEWCAKHEEQK